MRTQLFFDLTGELPRPSVHFRESQEVEEATAELRKQDVVVFEIDGSAISTHEDLFKAFAIALRMPKGWFGEEEYASNANAFLEYLDDVVEWVPAKGHVVLIRSSERFWHAAAKVAGDLIELWQCATIDRHAAIHLVFVW